MMIDPSNSPLTTEQASGLNHLLDSLEPHQFDWLAGFIAGWQASRRTGPASNSRSAAASEQRPSLTVLYGSQTGNAEHLAEALGEQASAHGIDVRVIDMAEYKPRQLKHEGFVAVITSTHGEGEPPDNALDLHEFLHGRKAPSLKHLKYGVLALGDTSYAHFCQTGREFDAVLEGLGASRLVARVDCDVDYDDAAEGWCSALLEALQGEAGAAGILTAGGGAATGAAATQRHDRRHPFPASVLENLVLNGRGSAKETRHIELSLEGSGLSYRPGDALGIYARNDPRLVAAIIEGLALDPAATVHLGEIDTTLSQALSHHREISPLTRPVVEKWAALGNDETLGALLADPAELVAWLEGRDLLDLIEAHPVPAITPDELVPLLRKLPPRLYSIASSQAAVEEEVHLTVAAVRFEAHGRRRERAAEVWRWLERGAHLYVCGDADAMAADVHAALLDVIVEAGGKSHEEATDYLRELTRQKRYQRDIY
ncbi:flavodoxin domain-containing protein [Halomonas sp. H10-9-1]|uniref:diflavin oxidoreductase n=1 Tax=Halomonas sp. H10-9-1 TaxID=2950871 RepID=UPI0032DE8FB9